MSEINEFDELNNENFKCEEIQPLSKEEKAEQKQNEKIFKNLERQRLREQKQKEKDDLKMLKQMKENPKEEEDDLYSDRPTEIIGESKRNLLNKITQYKLLFPSELGKFKIKKNSNVDDLYLYLQEMDSIISTGNIDGFIFDGIFQSLKVIEGVSANFKNYNLTGLSEILKNNPQFCKLCKQLSVKYGVFSKTSPEIQLLFIVLTASYICALKNKQKDEIEKLLNQTI